MGTSQKKRIHYEKKTAKRKNGKKKKENPHPNKKRDNHHVYPRSRGKRKDLGKFKGICGSLTLKMEIKKHGYWHHIFLNLFPEETIILIKRAFKKGNKSPEKIISFIKQNIIRDRSVGEATAEDMFAWEKIFGDQQKLWGLIKIILKDWTYRGIKAKIIRKKVSGVMIFWEKMAEKPRNKITRIISQYNKNIQFIILRNGKILKLI